MIDSQLPNFPKKTLIYTFILTIVFSGFSTFTNMQVAKEIQSYQKKIIELYNLNEDIYAIELDMDIDLIGIFTSIDYYQTLVSSHYVKIQEELSKKNDVNDFYQQQGYGKVEQALYEDYQQQRKRLLSKIKAVEDSCRQFNQNQFYFFKNVDQYILAIQEKLAFDEDFYQAMHQGKRKAIEQFNQVDHLSLRKKVASTKADFKNMIQQAYAYTLVLDDEFINKASFISVSIISIIAILWIISYKQLKKWAYDMRESYKATKAVQKRLSDLADGRLEILRQIANDLVLSEQREREKFAQSLHDDLQPLLAAARLRLGTLELNPQGKTDLDKISSILEQAILQSRQMMLNFNPPCLLGDDLSESESLTWLQRWLLQTHQFELRWHHLELMPKLTREKELFLFYSIREFCLNSIKHGKILKADGYIHIENEYLLVNIHDDGNGFDLNILENTELYQSYGLKNIRNRLSFWGGRLQLTSELNAGFDVKLYIPLDVEAKCLFEQLTPKPNINALSQSEHMKLLVVEDNEKFRAEVVDLLTKAGIEVVGQATTGPQAVELAKQLDVEVVLMDITLPGFNGIQATKEISALNKNLIIIGFSMFDEQDMGHKMREAGAKDYLQKGIDGLSLCACLSKHWNEYRIKSFKEPQDEIDCLS
jgi:signal transduction histidine kinase/ActR/RegA family two-component response regulator